MTTANPSQGLAADRPARAGLRFILGFAFALASMQAMAANPVNPSATGPAPGASSQVNLQANLEAVAPVNIATADTAPLAAQLLAMEQAQANPTASDRIKTVLQGAFALLGTPYRWGGTSPDSGFDCSGLVGYVFRTIGINLPRVSRAMASEGTPVADRKALAEGDLVFFGKRGKVDHVGIYIGQGKFLHAPRTGRDVTVSSLDSGYWSQKYMQARRIASGS